MKKPALAAALWKYRLVSHPKCPNPDRLPFLTAFEALLKLKSWVDSSNEPVCLDVLSVTDSTLVPCTGTALTEMSQERGRMK